MHKYPSMKGPVRPVWVVLAVHGGTPSDEKCDVKVVGAFTGPDAANNAAKAAIGERCHRAYVVCADAGNDLLPSRAFHPHSGGSLPTQDEIAWLSDEIPLRKIEATVTMFRAYLNTIG